MSTSAESRLLDAYIANMETIGDGFPAQINARRSAFIESFKLAGLPTRRSERYARSDIRHLYEGAWSLRFGAEDEAAESPLAGVEGYHVCLCNGFTDGRLYHGPGGMIFGSLRRAAGEFPDFVERYLNAVADNDDPLAALNGAFMQDGIVIYVPAGVKLPKPLIVDEQYACCGEVALSAFGRILVVLGRGAEASVTLVRRGAGTVVADCVREILLEPDARLSLTQTDCGAEGVADISACYIRQAEGSQCDIVAAELGGGFRRMSWNTELAGRGSRARLWGLFVDTDTDHTDREVRVHHAVPECCSYESVKGIASGRGSGAFSGHVYVAPDAQHTEAVQVSRNLLVGEAARIYARPQLEIYADDVKCSHGATVGQLDREAVYYMRQRGLSLAEAERLQIEGFVEDILAHSPEEPVRSFMEGLVAAKLGRL